VYRSIVVGTDGSATAQEAVRQAAALAALCGARLSIVSAYRPVSASAALAMSGAAGGLVIDTSELLDQQRQEAEEVLEHVQMSLASSPVRATTHAVPGNAAEVLLQHAAQVKADLLVVGSRGMQGAQRFLLGSVPNRVAHHAGCNVLVVHTC